MVVVYTKYDQLVVAMEDKISDPDSDDDVFYGRCRAQAEVAYEQYCVPLNKLMSQPGYRSLPIVNVSSAQIVLCTPPFITHLDHLAWDSYEPTLSKLVKITEEQINLSAQTHETTSGEAPSEQLDGVESTARTLMASAQRVDMDSKVALAIRWVLRYIEHSCASSWLNSWSQCREEKYASSWYDL